MILKDFIEQFVEKNTLIRLWYKVKGGYSAVYYTGERFDSVSMEWETLKGEGKYGEYMDNEVIGVTDILVTKTNYPEAVNIVIKEK